MLKRTFRLLASTLTLLALPILSQAQVQFGMPQMFLTGDDTRGVVVGDFNKDGKSDIASVNRNGGGSNRQVSVLLNQGSGQFAPAVHYALTGYGIAIATSDFNRDGQTDLIALNSTGTLFLLRNTGGGAFLSTSLPAGSNATNMAVGDSDNNGTEDIVLCNPDASVSILRGNGNGGFAAPVTYPTTSVPFDVAIADFNNDARTDLVITTAVGVGILLQKNDGSFATPAALYQAGSGAQFVRVGDFNNDNKKDVVIVNTNENGAINVLLGNGNGTFQPAVPYAAGRISVMTTIGDFNADGVQDIAVANYGSQNVSVFIGNGNGTFQNARSTTTTVQLYGVATGDFDGDGRQDIVSSAADQRSVFVIPNNSLLYTLGGTITLEDSTDPEQLVKIELRPTSYTGPTLIRKAILKPAGSNIGTFQVSGIPSGYYDVVVKVTGWLQRTQNVALLNDVSNFAATLFSGDANGDNAIDVLDLDILIRNFDKAGDL